MKRLEKATLAYWECGVALRHPTAPAKAAGEALNLLQTADTLRPEEWRLRELMHIVRYDIIEGNSKWRETKCVNGSVLTLPMRG